MIDLTIFTEPLGIMRIFQFIFAILAFSSTTSYTGSLDLNCNNKTESFPIEYPFHVVMKTKELCPGSSVIDLDGDYSREAHFFFITGILAMLYTLIIAFIYFKMEDMYKNNPRLPLIDFIATVILAVFWLSGTAAWASSVSSLKSFTDPFQIKDDHKLACCVISRQGFTRLTISIMLGFLNFFLWASDLWFVYKETAWFQNYQNRPTSR